MVLLLSLLRLMKALDTAGLQRLKLFYGLLKIADDPTLGAAHQLVVRLDIIILVHMLELAKAVDEGQLALAVKLEGDFIFEYLALAHLLQKELVIFLLHLAAVGWC